MWLAKNQFPIICVVAVALVLITASSPAGAEQLLIAEVVVQGNQYISADVIIDEVNDILKIGESYSEQKSLAARERIMKMGYFDTVTIAHEQTDDEVKVIIEVVERQRIEQIVFAGNTTVSDEKLREEIISKVGHIISASRIRRDAGNIENYYAQGGYIAQVADVEIDEFGVLTFVINEASIEAIVIEGLEKTQEWVVRRQIRTQPGELYQRKKIVDDINNIFNMELFADVKLDVRQAKKEPLKAVIVAFQIEEKPTGSISVSAAYSELDDFVAMLSVAENNLRGRAERASLDLELFGRTSYDFKFYEPYLDSQNTEMQLRVFDTQRQRRFVGGMSVSLAEDEFEEHRTGATVSLARPLTETERVSLGLRTEEVSSSFLQGTRSLGGSVGTLAEPGPQRPGPGDMVGPIIVAAPLHPGGRVNSMTLGWSSDTRDIIANPTSGSYQNLSVDLAGGWLGGESNYQQYRWDQCRYMAMRGGTDVLAMRLLLGTTTGDIPLFDSFSVGGSTTLRGYQQDRYRGENMVLFNGEYRYGLSDALTLVVFVDAGDAYGGTFRTPVPGFDINADDQDLQIHTGIGFGIRAVTPLGPLRLDFGFGEDGSQTHFGFGHTF